MPTSPYMRYFLAIVLAIAGLGILIWNKPLSKRFGAFYSQRFGMTFGKLARYLRWDDPTRLFNRFLYRGFVITAGVILLIFAFAAFFGPIYVGSAAQNIN